MQINHKTINEVHFPTQIAKFMCIHVVYSLVFADGNYPQCTLNRICELAYWSLHLHFIWEKKTENLEVFFFSLLTFDKF